MLSSVKKFLTDNINANFDEVKFLNEEGQDGGGLSREFFDLAGKKMYQSKH